MWRAALACALVAGCCGSRPAATALVQPEPYCGAVWVSDLELVTAAHCVRGAEPGDTVSIVERGARVAFSDPSTDVAVLVVLPPAACHGVAKLVDGRAGDAVDVAGVSSRLVDEDTIDVQLSRGASGSGAFTSAGGLVGIAIRRVPEGTAIAPARVLRIALATARATSLPTITPPSWEEP